MANNPGRKKVAVPKGGWPTGRKEAIPAALPEVAGKRPVVLHVDNEAINERKLVWRFGQMDTDGQWSPTNISPSELANLFDKMTSFETMTIGEIFAPGSEHGKKYAVASMPSAPQKRLSDLQREDETEVARLRCSGPQRLYGFLREHVFHVLWWDPTHAVWPSTK
ncbi:hypothetical protein N9A08_12905 [Arthrobacter koreensis]|uniref:Chromo domain-containing protein n=1 Tax=Arthrobacter koreensis TaxID=199136 RepID=A0ABY6FRY3_9MICC|nr:hypothetical protein [Arthrobacter koreensis]UYB35516.1 hypothetical protein N9A08_12905 [Arthrobacter koreensis]